MGVCEVRNEQSYIGIDGQARAGHRVRFVMSGKREWGGGVF